MERKVLDILKQVLKSKNIDESVSMQSSENWDSLAHVNLVTELEMEFGVSFEPEEFPELFSYEAIVSALRRKGVD